MMKIKIGHLKTMPDPPTIFSPTTTTTREETSMHNAFLDQIRFVQFSQFHLIDIGPYDSSDSSKASVEACQNKGDQDCQVDLCQINMCNTVRRKLTRIAKSNYTPDKTE